VPQRPRTSTPDGLIARLGQSLVRAGGQSLVCAGGRNDASDDPMPNIGDVGKDGGFDRTAVTVPSPRPDRVIVKLIPLDRPENAEPMATAERIFPARRRASCPP
jgi:hypothetical protein